MASGIDGDHASCAGEIFYLMCKIGVIFAVSMEKDHRFTCAFSRIEKTDAIDFDGVGIALI